MRKRVKKLNMYSTCYYTFYMELSCQLEYNLDIRLFNIYNSLSSALYFPIRIPLFEKLRNQEID